MFRKIGLFFVVFIIAFSSINIFAFANIHEGDVNYFLEKLASIDDDEKRQTGAWVLSTYLDKDDPDLIGLKLFIRNTASPDDIEKLEAKGYSLDEALDSLDFLEEFTREDVQNLVSSIENKDIDKMREIIDSYYEEGDKEEKNDEEGEKAVVDSDEEEVASEEKQLSEEQYKLIEVKFEDIIGHWAEDNIKFLAERKVIDGYSESEFGPNKNISRAEFTTLIVKLLGFEVKNENNILFEDIDSKNWFYIYVKAAKDNGVIGGVNEKQFMPLESITREQMIHIVIKALEQAGYTERLGIMYVEDNLSRFEDKVEISSWANESFSKAVKLGIIKGRGEKELAPKEKLTRAEAATIIRSVYDLIYI